MVVAECVDKLGMSVVIVENGPLSVVVCGGIVTWLCSPDAEVGEEII